MSDAQRALLARGLGKDYGQRAALAALELEIAPGELVALVGENGAGKTTTLAMFSGQLVPDRGEALICGHDVYRAPIEARRRVGYVAQDLLLPPYLTVGEMAEFACGVKGIALDRGLLDQLLARTGLQQDVDRLIGELSHGMQRKAAWVAALVTTPPVLLLDEGLAGLDAASAAAVVAMVAERVEGGAGILWAEHDLALLGPHVTRVVVLHGGRCVEVVPGADLRRTLGEGRLGEQMRRWTDPDLDARAG